MNLRCARWLALLFLVGCGDDLFVPNESQRRITTQNDYDKVDVLFVIDNSSSMLPKQERLIAEFPRFVDRFTKARPAWYHFGVITSDLGAGSFTDSLKQCQPGGDGGRLQLLGAAHDAACQPVTGGGRFIDYNQLVLDEAGQPTSNLPAGQSLGTTFGCMASVGDAGCGFEQPLEAARLALLSPPVENEGFLRDDAYLVVIFLTDEDDCSAPEGSLLYDPGAVALGGFSSYRCSRYSVVCGPNAAPLPDGPSNGKLTDCRDADASVNLLHPVARYIDLFRKPKSQGGVKASPGDVLVFDISATADWVQTVATNPAGEACDPPYGVSCSVKVAPTCALPSDSRFAADPAVRLRQVVRTVGTGGSSSVCDDSYDGTMETIAKSTLHHMVDACLTLPLADPSDPQCTVKEYGTETLIPRCDKSHGVLPCWQLDTRPETACASVCARPGDPAQRAGVVVRRATGAARTSTLIECAVLDPRPTPDAPMPTCAMP